MKKIVQLHFDIVVALSTVFLVVFLDRITKNLFSELLFVGESIPLIRGIFEITLVHNTGMAFGLFRDQGIIFIIIPIIAVALLFYNVYHYQRFENQLSVLYVLGFSMVLGGALGNLIDRVLYGYVIDFIDFQIWPVFNIADSAITIGAVLIAVKILFLTEEKR